METLYIIFILDQLTYRIFNYDPISNIIYSFFIATYFIKNYFIFSRERRIFVLSFIFFIFLSIRDFDNYVYFASTLITFLSFNHSNFLRNNINNIRIIIFSRYLRITLYISFFLFLVTYLGFTNFGFDNQNIFGEGMDGFTYRIRNSGTYTFNVFRSFFASSNYFGIIIFLTANFFYRFKTEINLNKIIYLINFVMIIIMSFFGDSRIITLLTLLVSIYAINDDLISIVKKVNKYLLFSIYITIPVVAYFIYPKIFPIIRGIIFIPNTIKERLPEFLSSNLNYTFLGNGFGYNWSNFSQQSYEYLFQHIIAEFGLFGLLLVTILISKLIFDIILYLKFSKYKILDKFIYLMPTFLFTILIIKASSDLRNIPLAITFGFFYPQIERQSLKSV